MAAKQPMAELLWVQSGALPKLCLWLSEHTYRDDAPIPETIRIADLTVPVIRSVPQTKILYRHPFFVSLQAGELVPGPVFAVLTAMRQERFAGNRADIRALTATVKRNGGFMYVLPVNSVQSESPWFGYVRVGPKRWERVPCPKPDAIYNRIPFRAMERTDEAERARKWILQEQIPMFNPEYFNKANLYKTIAESAAARYLPATDLGLDETRLARMLQQHGAIYLKPCGGSIGHGMIRIETTEAGCVASCVKNNAQVQERFSDIADAWPFVMRHRVPGRYVIQAAKTLLTWQGRPADFRVLLQKYHGEWHLVGRGVRVAGTGGITTHVPNGGSIVSADRVLVKAFGGRAHAMDEALTAATLACARAIDASYREQLGEMSMDIGIEADGHIWFLEANAKPMKFDEPNIRKASLEGVVRRLMELRQSRSEVLSTVH